jgi:tetratricopeptide (TPR) repeat protein
MQVWLALSRGANARCHYADWAEAAERAITHARTTNTSDSTYGLGVALATGPRPADEALATYDALLSEQPHPNDLLLRGVLLAQVDRVDEAWAVALTAEERARELGWEFGCTWLSHIALVAGDDIRAAQHLREACDLYEAGGNTPVLSTQAPLLGRVLCALGRHEEAEQLAAQGRELGDPDDVLTQTLWRETEALVQSHHGEHTAAVQLAREAVGFAEATDALQLQAEALECLAEVLQAAGSRDEALSTWEKALERYERKGVVPLARRVRGRLAALLETPTEWRPDVAAPYRQKRRS